MAKEAVDQCFLVATEDPRLQTEHTQGGAEVAAGERPAVLRGLREPAAQRPRHPGGVRPQPLPRRGHHRRDRPQEGRPGVVREGAAAVRGAGRALPQRTRNIAATWRRSATTWATCSARPGSTSRRAPPTSRPATCARSWPAGGDPEMRRGIGPDADEPGALLRPERAARRGARRLPPGGRDPENLGRRTPRRGPLPRRAGGDVQQPRPAASRSEGLQGRRGRLRAGRELRQRLAQRDRSRGGAAPTWPTRCSTTACCAARRAGPTTPARRTRRRRRTTFAALSDEFRDVAEYRSGLASALINQGGLEQAQNRPETAPGAVPAGRRHPAAAGGGQPRGGALQDGPGRHAAGDGRPVAPGRGATRWR